jgi:hypothetical protein
MVLCDTWSNVQASSWYLLASTTLVLAPIPVTARASNFTQSHATANWRYIFNLSVEGADAVTWFRR